MDIKTTKALSAIESKELLIIVAIESYALVGVEGFIPEPPPLEAHPFVEKAIPVLDPAVKRIS